MADLIADPFRAARLVLHLRQEGVTDDDVLKVMETIDRGAFVGTEALEALAFEDCVIPIPCGQIIPSPAITGHLIQALDLKPTRQHRVLVVGMGSGYTATLISQLAADVFGVERYRRLADDTRQRIIDLALPNMAVKHGDGLIGWPERGPYDRILLTGLVSEVPDELLKQITPSGFVVAPMIYEGKSRLVRIGYDGVHKPGFEILRLPPLGHGASAAL